MTSIPDHLRRRTLLIILDGFGINPDPTHNAVVQAKTPNFDRLFAEHPMTTLEASGSGVGLPPGQMGNSEVGHMTIGCGSIMKQDLVRINDAVADGSFFENPVLLAAVLAARVANRPLHLAGLVSNGGVHSHLDHLIALIQLCHRHDVVAQLHMITDGRDTAQQIALQDIAELQQVMTQYGGRIATVCGRYYAMDRDNRWDRVKLAWDNITRVSAAQVDSAQAAVEQSYADGVNDEFIKPAQLSGFEPVLPGDEMIFFNFRNDRARQICAAFANEDFDGFDRAADYQPIRVSTMTDYGGQLQSPIAFAAQSPDVTLGSTISDSGFRQLHCAETEKYPHVTFFFNGGREAPYAGEVHKLIQSPKVATYDLQPEMSAAQVADEVIDGIQTKQFEFIVVNFANGDMVGHTAIREAIIEAVEVLDREVGRVLEVAQENGFSVLLSADHGNCDEMVDAETGKPHTQHSNHPVPCVIIDDQVTALEAGGNLSAIAPTVLQLMGIAIPASMGGRSVIRDVLSG